MDADDAGGLDANWEILCLRKAWNATMKPQCAAAVPFRYADMHGMRWAYGGCKATPRYRTQLRTSPLMLNICAAHEALISVGGKMPVIIAGNLVAFEMAD